MASFQVGPGVHVQVVPDSQGDRLKHGIKFIAFKSHALTP